MANKSVLVGIARTRPRFDGNPALTGYGEFPTFSVGYGDGYGDVHIPAIIPIPAISSFSFKLLKYSQLIK